MAARHSLAAARVTTTHNTTTTRSKKTRQEKHISNSAAREGGSARLRRAWEVGEATAHGRERGGWGFDFGVSLGVSSRGGESDRKGVLVLLLWKITDKGDLGLGFILGK